MLKIKRLDVDKYQLVDSEGSVIAEYHQTKMTHPHDWIDDARDAGYDINGPYGWQFIDKRDE